MSDPVTVQKFAMGQSVSRVEDPRLVQGLGRYSDDVNLPRQTYAVVVRSPHAHARIARIDAAAALRSPGVLAVLTGADLAADGVGNLPTDATRKRRDGSPAFTPPRPALARDRVRHVGDPVALVVATSPEAATDAADLVAVEYVPLPAVTGADRATRAGAPAVWDEAPDNVAFVWEAGSRDTVARAFAQATHVIHLDFVVTRVAAAPLEPRAAVGEFDRRSGRYTLHTGIQGPHGLRAQLAEQIFRVPHGQVRVVTGEVGGSFGMRSGMYPELVLVLWAAKRLGRPVKWTSSRREGFLSDEPGRDNLSAAELALDARGRFLALRVALKIDIGAYLTPRSAGPATNNVGGLAGVYTTPAIHIESTGVYSNTTPTGPYRGAGRPEATYAIERVIDVAARELGIDPLDLRRRNMIPASSMPFKTGLVFTYDCGDFARGMDMALGLAERDGFEKRRAGSPGARQAARPGHRQSHRGGGRTVHGREPRHRRGARQSGRLGGPVHGLDIDGTGQRDGLCPDRERPAGRAVRAHPGVLGRQRCPGRRPRQRWLGSAQRRRLGGGARDRQDDRTRASNRRAPARSRRRGRGAARREVHRGRNRPEPAPGRRRAGGLSAAPASPRVGVRFHRRGVVHAAGGDVPQRYPRV